LKHFITYRYADGSALQQSKFVTHTNR